MDDAAEGDTGGLLLASTVETEMFFFLRRFGGPEDEERLRLFPNILLSGFASVGLVPVKSSPGNSMNSVREGMAGSSGGVGARRGEVYNGGSVEGETLGTTLSGFSNVSFTACRGLTGYDTSPSF